tara:strand:+ start:436 stop:537 length:102 start_codon:yes stop_codon:yes gene_type:complete
LQKPGKDLKIKLQSLNARLDKNKQLLKIQVEHF